MTQGRKILIGLAIVVVIFGLGYAWGASGRGALRSMAEEAAQGLALAEARGAILEARVSLYNNNFGDASRQLESAKESLRRLRDRYDEAGDRDGAARVDAAVRQVEVAQSQAGKLDSGAQTSAAQALDALGAK
jgi:hypothetical protein